MIDKAIERHRSESNLTKGKVYILVILSIYNMSKNINYIETEDSLLNYMKEIFDDPNSLFKFKKEECIYKNQVLEEYNKENKKIGNKDYSEIEKEIEYLNSFKCSQNISYTPTSIRKEIEYIEEIFNKNNVFSVDIEKDNKKYIIKMNPYFNISAKSIELIFNKCMIEYITAELLRYKRDIKLLDSYFKLELEKKEMAIIIYNYISELKKLKKLKDKDNLTFSDDLKKII